MWNPMLLEDDLVGGSREELSTGDWIALRRLAQMQSLTDRQVQRLVQLGLAEHTPDGFVCTEHGRKTLQTRP